ncbi:MAG: beta-ketoacyl-ACP synthase II [Actinomycetia bacterium]|nr:beta-ketoacyl-ACP synthase II [Actinomycetes bacterium]
MEKDTKERRVVVTGLAAITALGLDIETFWKNIIAGESGVSTIEGFDLDKIGSKIAAQVKNFKPADFMDIKLSKRMDRFAQFGYAGAGQAIEDSGLAIDKDNGHLVGVYIGSGVGGLSTLETQHIRMLEKGANRVSPFLIPMIISNMAAAQVSIMSGAKGPVSTTTTACAAGSNAIGDAYEIIKRGDALAMIAGGSEAPITPLGMSGFSNMNALSTRNDQPQKASRPFDRDRDGFVMGEGCGIVILEELEHALNRGAKIYAEMFGYGLSGEAYHMTALEQSGENVARCMNNCLQKGDIGLDEVDYINAHGTSTPLNDIVESTAIERLFGENAKNINISSTKSMTGHCLGAAGAIESVASILAIINNIIPPTINLDNPDDQCRLNYTPHQSIEREVDVAISNSMGFGGHNVCLGFKKWKP